MKLIAALALLLFSVFGVQAQSTYDSISGATIDPPRMTFIFGHVVNGQPGTTELILQCDFNRGWLITNYDVYGEQASSQFFPISCDYSATAPVSYSLAGNPLTETLTMTNQFGQVTGTINLTIHYADWHKTTHYIYRWPLWMGSSEIEF